MQPECGIFFVGQTWMGPLRVQSLESSIHEVLAVIAPFVEITADKRRAQVRQVLTAGFTGPRRWTILWINQWHNIIEERFVEGAELPIGCSPVPLCVGLNCLVQMAKRGL